MGQAIKLSDTIVQAADIYRKAYHRSKASQIEHWATIGKIAEENPDLNYFLIKDILIAQAEAKAGKIEPYQFD